MSTSKYRHTFPFAGTFSSFFLWLRALSRLHPVSQSATLVPLVSSPLHVPSYYTSSSSTFPSVTCQVAAAPRVISLLVSLASTDRNRLLVIHRDEGLCPDTNGEGGVSE